MKTYLVQIDVPGWHGSPAEIERLLERALDQRTGTPDRFRGSTSAKPYVHVIERPANA